MEQRLECLGKMRKQIKSSNYRAFYYRQDEYMKSRSKCSCSSDKVLQEQLAINESTLWSMTPTPLGDVKLYNFEDLKDMTDDYDYNFRLKETMHGKLYKGSIRDDKGGEGMEEVIIKTWDFLYPNNLCYLDHPSRFCNELEILTDENRHPCLMKLKGFCFQKILSVVYDEGPTMNGGKPKKFLHDEHRCGCRDIDFDYVIE